MIMSRKEYKRYFETLELTPGASLKEIKNTYEYLKKLYSTDSVETSPIADEFLEEKRHEILQHIEEAYTKILALVEKEASESTYHKESFDSSLDSEEEKQDSIPFIENLLKQIGSVLSAKNLKKSFYHRLVVKGIDIEIRSGEIIGLLGRNGAGKTTTFQMIVGLIKPDSGAIFLNKKNISQHSTYRKAEEGISYLPQENSVFLKETVENNIKLVLELQDYTKKERKKKAKHLLEELGLLPLAKQHAHSLSGGERRKLEICRSLAIKPKFLLLDEPFTGIDPLTIVELQRILVKLRNRGIGIILSDHNVRDTFKIANRAYIIDEGEILVEGSPQEIAAEEIAKERFLGKNFKFGDEVEIYSS